jgi:hypothetical protein
MRFAFDLSQYDDVKTNAQGIYDRLVDGSMPCDGAWPEDRIALFRSGWRRAPRHSALLAHLRTGFQRGQRNLHPLAFPPAFFVVLA